MSYLFNGTYFVALGCVVVNREQAGVSEFFFAHAYKGVFLFKQT